MKGDAPKLQKTVRRWTRARRTSRKLNFPSRIRSSFRRGADRVLGADVAWSITFVVIVVALIGSQRCGGELKQFEVGDVAAHDIIAVSDANVTDIPLTEERRQEARKAVPDVYVHNTERRFSLSGELSAVFEEGRRLLAVPRPEGISDTTAIAQGFGERLPPEVVETLAALRFDATLERDLASALAHAMRGPIVGNKTLLAREPSIVLVQVPGGREQRIDEYDSIGELAAVRASLEEDLARRLDLPRAREATLIEFTSTFVDANVHLDSEATQLRRDLEARKVPPVLVRVARGDVLVAQGETLTSDTIRIVDEARRQSQGYLGMREVLGLLLIVSALAFFLYRYSLYHQRRYRKIKHLHALLLLMLLSMLLLSEALTWLSGELADNLIFPFNQLSAYTYLIPLGAGAILIALLANGRIATVYSAFGAVLFGALNGEDFHLALWAFTVQLSGVYAISTYRERKALLRAGLVVGGAGAVAALALASLKGTLEPVSVAAYEAGLAFVGGAVGVGLIISFSLPLLEGLFNVLTDIRLLELSNVNNPLLSELAVKAPGSYNHSLVVGTLAEEAARAIGANSLLCKVAAFYHDIGKLSHPEYFVENQRGANAHDRLTPSMSALVIASHVKDGIKMAREAGLPEQIVDMIPQHHGTKLMTYFYEKAKNSSDSSQGRVKEEDFRYPGPKPQTREAAIFMISDAVEAAARTVDEPTPNRLRELIRKLTNSIVLDGQLDSCELTFSELERIQEALLRLLVSMYHHRVDYPGFDFRRPKREPKASTEIAASKIARGS